MKTGKDVAGVFDGILSFVRALVTVGHVPFITPMVKLMPPDPRVESFLEFCNQCYFARVDDPSPSRDIFRHLVRKGTIA